MEGQGQIDFFEEGQRYEGSFSDNKINGKGIYKWKNGDVYIGDMKNGKMHGFGKYDYSDGKIYEGEFFNDIKQGKGKMTFPDGTIHEGNFVNGELNEEIKNDKNNWLIKKYISKIKGRIFLCNISKLLKNIFLLNSLTLNFFLSYKNYLFF